MVGKMAPTEVLAAGCQEPSVREERSASAGQDARLLGRRLGKLRAQGPPPLWVHVGPAPATARVRSAPWTRAPSFTAVVGS